MEIKSLTVYTHNLNPPGPLSPPLGCTHLSAISATLPFNSQIAQTRDHITKYRTCSCWVVWGFIWWILVGIVHVTFPSLSITHSCFSNNAISRCHKVHPAAVSTCRLLHTWAEEYCLGVLQHPRCGDWRCLHNLLLGRYS